MSSPFKGDGTVTPLIDGVSLVLEEKSYPLPKAIEVLSMPVCSINFLRVILVMIPEIVNNPGQAYEAFEIRTLLFRGLRPPQWLQEGGKPLSI